eukprot:TRINITY_DN9528_c0_g2_i3.p1 TRINITY_DN9528_c0_g2~~TRINITY_DN9528_c0_g2_i3.p1  ORF type:complete len:157 (+),score=23.76 TRINITY_DN9528_c0_g2_i3:158-628(+)
MLRKFMVKHMRLRELYAELKKLIDSFNNKQTTNQFDLLNERDNIMVNLQQNNMEKGSEGPASNVSGTGPIKCVACQVNVKGFAFTCGKCLHVYHLDHYKEWFMNEKNKRCPLCSCYCKRDQDQIITSLCFCLSCSCLLYTSPSPRDGLLSRMPSSA